MNEVKTRQRNREKVSQIKEQYVQNKSLRNFNCKNGEILTQKNKYFGQIWNFTYKTSIIRLVLNSLYLLIISTIFILLHLICFIKRKLVLKINIELYFYLL